MGDRESKQIRKPEGLQKGDGRQKREKGQIDKGLSWGHLWWVLGAPEGDLTRKYRIFVSSSSRLVSVT